MDNGFYVYAKFRETGADEVKRKLKAVKDLVDGINSATLSFKVSKDSLDDLVKAIQAKLDANTFNIKFNGNVTATVAQGGAKAGKATAQPQATTAPTNADLAEKYIQKHKQLSPTRQATEATGFIGAGNVLVWNSGLSNEQYSAIEDIQRGYTEKLQKINDPLGYEKKKWLRQQELREYRQQWKEEYEWGKHLSSSKEHFYADLKMHPRNIGLGRNPLISTGDAGDGGDETVEKSSYALAGFGKALKSVIAFKAIEKLFKMVDSMAKYGSQIGIGAEAIGASAETVSRLSAMGVSMGTLTGLQSRLAGGQVGDFDSELARFLAMLGFSYEQAYSMDVGTLFQSIVESALGKVASGEIDQKTARYMVEKILGKEGAERFDVMSLLGFSTFDEYYKHMGGIASISDDASKSLTDLSESITVFKNNLLPFATALSDTLGITDNLGNTVKTMNASISAFVDSLNSGEGLKGAFKAGLDALVDTSRTLNESNIQEQNAEIAETVLGFGGQGYIDVFGRPIKIPGWIGKKLGEYQLKSIGVSSNNSLLNSSTDNYTIADINAFARSLLPESSVANSFNSPMIGGDLTLNINTADNATDIANATVDALNTFSSRINMIGSGVY